ncbi:MAG: hypothetical protein ABI700_22495 [Chloroflexota bacterium]
MFEDRPRDYVFYVTCPGERPFFWLMQDIVWADSSALDTDTDGDSYPAHSTTWTELTMITRDAGHERFDIDPVQDTPLILNVRSEKVYLVARAAYALEVYTGGQVSEFVDGAFESPDVLIPYMGAAFDLAAALRQNEWLNKST